MVTSNDVLRDGCFAVIGGVTYQVQIHRLETLRVHRGANDLSGAWRPDLSPDPVVDEVPCAAASRIFGVRTFAKWRGVGVRIAQVRHARGRATAFYLPIDLEVCGPQDWPRPVRSRTPPHGGLGSLKSHGNDPDDEFAGDVQLKLLTDIRQTEVDLPRDEDGNLLRAPGLQI